MEGFANDQQCSVNCLAVLHHLQFLIGQVGKHVKPARFPVEPASPFQIDLQLPDPFFDGNVHLFQRGRPDNAIVRQAVPHLEFLDGGNGCIVIGISDRSARNIHVTCRDKQFAQQRKPHVLNEPGLRALPGGYAVPAAGCGNGAVFLQLGNQAVIALRPVASGC